MLLGETPPASSWYPAWGEVVVLAGLAVAYVLAARRDPPSRLRSGLFFTGLALALLAVVSPVATIAVHYLVSAHLLQNVVLAEWVPALVVLGLGPWVAGWVAGNPVTRFLTRPIVALPLWLATYALWHIPFAYEAALGNSVLLGLEHLSYVVAGVFLWWPVFQEEPWHLSAGGKAAYLFAAFVLASPLGLLLALLPSPLYDTYVEAPRLWGLRPLQDQEIGGTLMAVSEAIVFFGLLVYFFVRFMAEEDAGYSHGDA
jgi:cytochrome c oxidase assembly factor CtaG